MKRIIKSEATTVRSSGKKLRKSVNSVGTNRIFLNPDINGIADTADG